METTSNGLINLYDESDEVFKGSVETFPRKFTFEVYRKLDEQYVDGLRQNKMAGDIEVLDLLDSVKVITWNRRFLNLMGVWPLKVYDPIFVFIFVYLVVHCTLAVVDLTNYSTNLDMLVVYISEILTLLNALVKVTICRLNRNSLALFLTDIQEDFLPKSYRNKKEILAFISYNKLSYLFITVAMPCMGFAASTYYIRSLAANVKMVMENSSFGYQLPYKTITIVEINDIPTYFFYCLYQLLAVPIITFGSAGYDSFFVTLSFHVTGQLSVLNKRVKDALEDPEGCRKGIKKLIIKHHRLIRLAGMLEDDFNIGILQHLLATMANICISGYNTLVGSSNGQSVTFIIFLVFAVFVLSTLFIYCYIGECFIQESTKFGLAFYDYEWYNISPDNLKLILICMLRASKPLQLTSGKFFVLSLCTFTDIIKASVGYFSVILTFL